MIDRYLILWKDKEKDNITTNNNFDETHKYVNSLIKRNINHIYIFDNYLDDALIYEYKNGIIL